MSSMLAEPPKPKEERRCILHDPVRLQEASKPLDKRHRLELYFRIFCIGVAVSSVGILLFLVTALVYQGVGGITGTFLTAPPSPIPDEAGMFPAIMGTVWLLVLTALFALPLGIGTAIMLEEFVPKNAFLRKARSFIMLNISNLAGVPSVVYGILGLTAFATMFGMFQGTSTYELGVTYSDQYYNEANRIIRLPAEGQKAEFAELKEGMSAFDSAGNAISVNVIGKNDPWPTDPALAKRTLRQGDTAGRVADRSWYYMRIPFGRGVLTGALTLMLVILPVIIIATQEALRAIPNSLRDGARGLGATNWQVVRRVTLPAAVPGIMTGSILAMSRAIGEAAPLLMIAGIVYITTAPSNAMDDFTAMPLQIYNWAGRPQEAFHSLAASGIIVLLIVLLFFNGIAIFIRQKFQKPLS